jgi:CxxC-x17-CxxC domain-containing protein
MFEAKCGACGKNAVVPFKPKPDKPVYCSSCFSKRVEDRKRNNNSNSSFNSKNAWARRDSNFRGKKEEDPVSIFQKY